jgi:hypothetical protein
LWGHLEVICFFAVSFRDVSFNTESNVKGVHISFKSHIDNMAWYLATADAAVDQESSKVEEEGQSNSLGHNNYNSSFIWEDIMDNVNYFSPFWTSTSKLCNKCSRYCVCVLLHFSSNIVHKIVAETIIMQNMS